jgi:hypothetical protein
LVEQTSAIEGSCPALAPPGAGQEPVPESRSSIPNERARLSSTSTSPRAHWTLGWGPQCLVLLPQVASRVHAAESKRGWGPRAPAGARNGAPMLGGGPHEVGGGAAPAPPADSPNESAEGANRTRRLPAERSSRPARRQQPGAVVLETVFKGDVRARAQGTAVPGARARDRPLPGPVLPAGGPKVSRLVATTARLLL